MIQSRHTIVPAESKKVTPSDFAAQFLDEIDTQGGRLSSDKIAAWRVVWAATHRRRG
jgi:hypothetical protein